MKKEMRTMDGNMAAAYASYAFTEAAAIYPITPSSNMGEYTDEWSAYGKLNMFGEPVRLIEMQSEAGAAGAVHGLLQSGALTTTYTASQGLLLMIPNMYKIAGELLPCVLQVSARTLATHALSIFGDHSDIYATRQTGFIMLASGSVQEVMDLTAVSHLASIEGSLPFLHFFDGFRTSHEIQKIELLDYEDLKKLVDMDAINKFRQKALSPDNPVTRGTAQNPDVYFQAKEASNAYYKRIPGIVANYMREISKLTGRKYLPFVYYGDSAATDVVVAMGSVTETLKETVDYLNKQGKKVGVISVHLYRPFVKDYFFDVLPKTVKKIAVLDRTKEAGSYGPMYLDVVNLFYGQKDAPVIIGGRYGLSSKDTTPDQMVAVFDNLASNSPKNDFTVGINDDVTFTSLSIPKNIDTVPEGTVEAKFYGLGSDGTVGANKNSIKIIGDHTDLYAQGYFSYDSKKSGGITVSHLRFGKDPIRSTYLVNNPTFVSCSVPSYLDKYDMLLGLKKGGSFLLNSIWDEAEVVKQLPDHFKKYLADNGIKFYIINATKIASDIGLGNRTNTIMQSAFFKLTNVIPYEQAVKFMKDAIVKSYSRKGEKIVQMNNAAVDAGGKELIQVSVDASWSKLKTTKVVTKVEGPDKDLVEFVNEIAIPINNLEGDQLPVSKFTKWADGTIPAGTSQYEKRGVAVNVPKWIKENCIQCNQCAYVCPHAAIRPFLATDDELKKAPANFDTIPALGKALEGLMYRMQVSSFDCMGCGSCVSTCPAKTKALAMESFNNHKDQDNLYKYATNNISYKDNLWDKHSVKGSQFARPLFEFSGACAGCGETPYIKLITQLYGDRMLVANATGCSSIYGGSNPASVYCKNDQGKGPAWANSLFEDNAEYGLGMRLAVDTMRRKIANLMTANKDKVGDELQALFDRWMTADIETSKQIYNELTNKLTKERADFAKEIVSLKQYLVDKSVWIIGGDGWAYDIGYGGLDHVLATSENVNVLVLDTEVYSNTGGQASKSSPTGSVAKFAISGKKTRKKDLGKMAMSYGYVYVAQVAMGANQAQFIKAVAEAESYNGPSLIIAYAPCINHGIKGLGMSAPQLEQKRAVESGYWHLYRYNPMLEQQGKNPFTLDSAEPDFNKYEEFLKNEVRYTSLAATFPKEAEKLFAKSLEDAKWRYQSYKKMT